MVNHSACAMSEQLNCTFRKHRCGAAARRSSSASAFEIDSDYNFPWSMIAAARAQCPMESLV